MEDLEKAKKRLFDKGLKLCIVKNGKVLFETSSQGISGFLEAIRGFSEKLADASIADKVVGKAIALLCVYTKAKAVFAVTLSVTAKAIFEQNGVYHECTDLVEEILNADETKSCLFEALVSRISKPQDAYQELKALQNSLETNGRSRNE